jgi:hypothetical protein
MLKKKNKAQSNIHNANIGNQKNDANGCTAISAAKIMCSIANPHLMSATRRKERVNAISI